MGIMSLNKTYPTERLETACRRALEARTLSCKSVRLMLKNNMEGLGKPAQQSLPIVIDHNNIRGADYYH